MDFLVSLSGYLHILVLLLGLVFLWKGSEQVIAGASDLARSFGISELIIGLTVVSIGSSTPEIFINLSSGAKNLGEVGVGTIVGSCLAQVSIITGIVVLMGGKIPIARSQAVRDGGIMTLSILWLFIMGYDGTIYWWEALMSMLFYVSYIAYLISRGKDAYEKPVRAWYWSVLLLIIGMGAVYLASEAIFTIGLHYGQIFGVNPGFIGILSGIGTSMPELIISVVALLHRHGGLSIGNLLGSNITDPLLSLSVGVLSSWGYPVSSYLQFTAFPVWFFLSLIATLYMIITQKIDRKFAIFLILAYLAAMVFVL